MPLISQFTKEQEDKMLHSEKLNFDDLLERAENLPGGELSESTWEGYQSDFRVFTAYCNIWERDALPASVETVEAYLKALQEKGRCVDTIIHHKNAIHKFHAINNMASPADTPKIKLLIKKLRREFGTKPKRKHALTTEEVTRMVVNLPDTLISKRNKAFILVGFAGAMRRSEISNLEFEDIAPTDDGIKITIRKAKTDTTGEGQTVYIPWGTHKETCPIRALFDWLTLSGVKTGPIFRSLAPSPFGYTITKRGISGATIARIIKELAETVGIDPQNVAGHSLRRGCATEAAKSGASLIRVSRHLRHKNTDTTQGYIDDVNSFDENNPVHKLGL